MKATVQLPVGFTDAYLPHSQAPLQPLCTNTNTNHSLGWNLGMELA